MVTQPVSFARETLIAYREWQSAKECYYDKITRFYVDVNAKPIGFKTTDFCWMCQLGTFMQTTKQTLLEKYALIDLDNRCGPAYQRFAIHTTYEVDNEIGLGYEGSTRRIWLEGVCRVFDAGSVPACENVTTEQHVDYATFAYAEGFSWGENPSCASRRRDYVNYFRETERKSRLSLQFM
jgi:hypothetical protein